MGKFLKTDQLKVADSGNNKKISNVYFNCTMMKK